MRNLVLYPDKKLRTSCEHITSFTEELKQLADEMNQVMIKHEGVGLAAPQVGELIRLLIVREGNSEKYRAYVNPEITYSSRKITATEEGCLSIPHVFGFVERAAKIRVSYQDLDGNKQSIKATGMDAIVLQHEIDHINGILIVDRDIEYTHGESLIQSS